MYCVPNMADKDGVVVRHFVLQVFQSNAGLVWMNLSNGEEVSNKILGSVVWKAKLILVKIHMTGASKNPEKLTLIKTWIAWLTVWTLKRFLKLEIEIENKNWKLKIKNVN